MRPRPWPDWANGLPEALRYSFMGIAAWQWIGLLLLVIIAVGASLAGRFAAVRAIDIRERMASERLTRSTEKMVRLAVGLLAGVAICHPLLDELYLPGTILADGTFVPGGFENAIRNLLQGATILAVVFLAMSLWDALCDTIAGRAAGHQRTERLLVPMARKFMRAVIIGVGLLVALKAMLRIDISAFIATLGISGLVIALAAKDSVENVFGSLTILFDMPFAIGDWVKIDKTEGIVEEINLRSTRIRTFEDTVITVPNANLIRATVENYSARRTRRQKLHLRVSYDSDPARVDAFCQDLRTWIAEQELVMPGKTVVNIEDVGEPSFGVLVQCLFKVKTQAEELALRHDLVMEILRLREKHGVLFAAHPRPLPPVPPEPKEPPPSEDEEEG